MAREKIRLSIPRSDALDVSLFEGFHVEEKARAVRIARVKGVLDTK